GGTVGGLLYWLMPGRRTVAATNLALCFPERDDATRASMLRENFRDLGRMLAEFAICWMASERRFARIPHRIDGLEHMTRAMAAGRGVLLVGAHFSHLELCARLIARHVAYAGFYREHGSP